MSAPGNTAPASDYEARKLDGRCTKGRCPEMAVDGAQQCQRHLDAARKAARECQERRRKRWAKQKRCLRCGRRRHPESTWGCPRCLAELGRLRDSGRAVNPYVNPRRSRTAGFDARIEGDGYARERYRGQGKRGPQPTEQLDDQDLRDAKKHFQRAAEALEYHNSDAGKGLPTGQRREIRDAADAEFNRAFGFVAEIWKRHRYSRPTVEDEEA